MLGYVSGFANRLVRLALAAVLVVGIGVAAIPATAPKPALADGGIPFGLHTSGGRIVDVFGRTVHIAAANWYGAESVDFAVTGLQTRSINGIARSVRQLGFNAVRLPWSNELLEKNPIVPDYAISANPELRGHHAMDVFDRVVRALTGQGLMVILDNHNSDAEWCCSNTDGNDLWYNDRFPESSWLADWKAMVARYRFNPLVVGVDLRNEPRNRATWGGPAATNWQAAAERGGDAVLSVNPRLLVFVEGVSFAGDLSAVGALPVQLSVPRRVVYEAHDYGWYEHGFNSLQQWVDQITPKWGYLVTGPHPVAVWVGEFGTCNTAATCVSSTSTSDNGFWFDILTTYLRQHDLGWAYWAVNGTQSTGAGRTWNAPETYGVLNTAYTASASASLTGRLQQLEGDRDRL